MNENYDIVLPDYESKKGPKAKKELYRYDNGAGDRYYFRFVVLDNTPIKYMGATTAVSHLMPASSRYYLEQYFKRYGSGADRLSKEAATEGTLMHNMIGDCVRNNMCVDFGEIGSAAQRAAIDAGYPYLASSWAHDIPRDIAAWIQFCQDKDVEVLGIEMPCWHDDFLVATQVDVYCRLVYNRKVRHAIINLKRGYRGEDKENKSKTYVEDYDCQLQIEKLLWHETYPEWQVDLVCNWSPNNWRTSPTYTFKVWTSTNWPESKLRIRLPQIHEDGRFNPAKPKSYMSGKYKPGDDLSKCIKQVVLKRKY